MIEIKRLARFAMPIGLAALLGAPLMADDYDKKTDVTFSEPVQVPGVVLPAGKYMFILLNSASSRHIVEVKSDDGQHLYAMIMTAAARRVEPTDKVVIDYYEMPAGTPNAIRQWFWPGDLDGQEFLYPHKEALVIAQATKKQVPEASEQDLASTKLPDNDTDTAAVQSQRSNSTSSVASTNESSQQSATVTTQQQSASTQSSNDDSALQAAAQPAPPPTADQSNNTVAQVSPSTSAQTVPDAQSSINQSNGTLANAAPDNSTLPQTASDLPTLMLIGFGFLTAGFCLKLAGRGIRG